MSERKTVLVLRTCAADMTSYGGFVWPTKGPVEAPDWKPTYKCGNGLHGLLWGEGDSQLLDWSDGARWLVVRVAKDDLLHGEGDLIGKCKFRRGVVVYCGDRASATEYMQQRGLYGAAVVGSTVTGGYRSIVTGGYGSTVTGGDWSTVTGGYGSTVTGGYGSTVTGGYGSTVTGGDWSTVTGGDWSIVTGGDWSTVTGGYGSTVTGGYGSTVTGGYGSTVTGGDRGVLIIRWYDTKSQTCNLAIARVGVNGIKPSTPYKVNDASEFYEVSE